jgi:phenylacetate-coenzyme A ligase PaaK-like adenylate-forming protein
MPAMKPQRGDLESIETASRDELTAPQLSRLRCSLQHAYDNVPHYRRAFEKAGVVPDECKSLAELARFPFTTKAALRDNYPFGMFAVPRDKILRIHASSGTTEVERAPGVGHANGESAGATLAHRIKNLIGVTAVVEVVQQGGIERSLGKAKRIVDKRPKG